MKKRPNQTQGNRRKYILGIALLGVVLLALGLYLNIDRIQRQFFTPREGSSAQEGLSVDQTPVASPAAEPAIEEVATGLQVPWDVAFLPGGDILVSERPGTIKRVRDGKTFPVAGVERVSEGGLLGIVLHPNFENNRWIYLYLTSETDNGLINRVERYAFANDELIGRTVIIDNIPGAQTHDGGRMVFGPDNMLYITTGDAGDGDNAQNTDSLAGKILRITDTGIVPADNPFGNAIYSYGHRNPQGLVWDDQGRLWSSEHGPSGLESGYDEINLIERGGNYGWPRIQGAATRSGMISPVIQSGADDTWAPASLAFLNGSLFFGGLRGEALYQADINGDNLGNLRAHFGSEYGRIRATVVGPNDDLYITTSNTDGRGEPKEGDDKLIRLSKYLFQ